MQMSTNTGKRYTPEGREIEVYFDGNENRREKKRVAAYCRVSTDSDEQDGMGSGSGAHKK